MRKILFVLFILMCVSPVQAGMYSCTDYKDYSKYYEMQDNKEILSNLEFSEKQIFSKTYKKENIEERIERLELSVYGAIQNGDKKSRIKKLKNDITGIAHGGNGLGYSTKSFGQTFNMLDLAGNTSGMSNWNIGNNYKMQTYNNNPHFPSHRIAPGHHKSHRIPSFPNNYSYNSKPITTGNHSTNYSIGTGIKILDD